MVDDVVLLQSSKDVMQVAEASPRFLGFQGASALTVGGMGS